VSCKQYLIQSSGVESANVHHRAKVEDWPNSWRDMATQWFSRMCLSAILEFLKFEVLLAARVKRVNMHHQPKFCDDRSNRYQDIAIFRFSKWRLSTISTF